ncbi:MULTISPECIES: addiction module antidote protein [Enterobacterales]|uniref:addiction module antidote protein n=1 Tax=Enterobacterales TaxID=91347 RepID=UPI000D73314B|nr:addiction module antidote protein [Serratia marcescens]EAO9402045.1 addiction module antidote protein [Salmonella enterica]EDD0543186.1 addiction module antidote protein [Salmonella enterica subsp. enterica serovar Senftenberg]HAN5025416.1 addiction module antidote protein [Escherichia coli]AWO80392.1 addiction module antidote protein [Serratia marcescens]EKK8119310.1 addiction module antidote protein [Salmonella enterica]
MKDRSHDTAMAEHFRANPTYAAELLAEVRRDGTPAEVAILLRQIATASAGGARSEDADIGRTLPL